MVRVVSTRRVRGRRLAATDSETRCDPRARLGSPRSRADRLCSVGILIFKPSRPSIGFARQKSQTRRELHQIATHPPDGGAGAYRARGTDPAVKTSNPCLTPRGARDAVGGISGLGGESWPQGQHVYHSTRTRRLREPDLQTICELDRESDAASRRFRPTTASRGSSQGCLALGRSNLRELDQLLKSAANRLLDTARSAL